MLTYIAKRLLLFIPTLLVVSLLMFFLSKLSEDSLLSRYSESDFKKENISSIEDEWANYTITLQKFGLDQPSFYFSFNRKSSSDTLNRIPDDRVRNHLSTLSYQYGNWTDVNVYYSTIKEVLFSDSFTNSEKQQIHKLIGIGNIEEIDHKIKELPLSRFSKLLASYQTIKENKSSINNYLITFKWNGLNNQYHQWISSFVKGDFGNSYKDDNSIGEKIKYAILWTLLLSALSLLCSFSIGILTGVYAALNPKSRLSKFLSTLFYVFYALPNFWVATLLILLFAGGGYFNLFPTYGLGYVDSSMGLWDTFVIRLHHIILPVICLSYGSIAFIFKQVKNSVQQQLTMDYVKTAQAKGLSHAVILKKQVFKNAFFPLITMLGGVLPTLISGSFVIEYIFSLPGMGKLTIDAFLSRDFPMIFSLLMISAFIGILGVLLADVLYFFLDPRVNFSNSKHSRS